MSNHRPHALVLRACFFLLLGCGIANADNAQLIPFPPEPGPVVHHEQHAAQKSCQVYGGKGAVQKGYGKTPGPWTPPPKKHHHWWCGPPPPEAPILDSAAILRIAGPVRRVRFRYEQEAGTEPEDDRSPESGGETDTDNLAQVNQKLNALEGRVNDLYDALDRLINQLSPPAGK